MHFCIKNMIYNLKIFISNKYLFMIEGGLYLIKYFSSYKQKLI